MWLKFEVIWWKFSDEMKKNLEEKFGSFLLDMHGWNGAEKRVFWALMKLPRETKMCGSN